MFHRGGGEEREEGGGRGGGKGEGVQPTVRARG